MADLARAPVAPVTRVLRLAFVIVMCTLVQAIVLPNIRVLGVVPDLGLVAAVAVAYEDGPEAGATFGFVAGFVLDLFLSTPAGLSALSWALTAFIVGIVSVRLVRATRWMPAIFGFGGGLLGGLLFCGVGALVGEEQLFALSSVRIVVIAATLDAIVAYAIFPLVRWSVRPSR